MRFTNGTPGPVTVKVLDRGGNVEIVPQTQIGAMQGVNIVLAAGATYLVEAYVAGAMIPSASLRDVTPGDNVRFVSNFGRYDIGIVPPPPPPPPGPAAPAA